MSRPTAITAIALEKILAFLAPLFLTGAQGDMAAATQAAREMLTCYGARTNKELRLAALTVAFSFGALDSLSRATAADLSFNQLMRLRGNAISLHRAAHKSQDSLDRLQKADSKPSEEDPAVDQQAQDLPVSVETPDLVAFTRPAQVSRQQRRAAERQAEKIRLRQREEAHRAERAAARAASPKAA